LHSLINIKRLVICLTSRFSFLTHFYVYPLRFYSLEVRYFVGYDFVFFVPPARVLFTQTAVYFSSVVAATVVYGANHLVHVLKPEYPPRLLVAPQTLMREMTALVTVPPATAYVLAHAFVPPPFRNIDYMPVLLYIDIFRACFLIYCNTDLHTCQHFGRNFLYF